MGKTLGDLRRSESRRHDRGRCDSANNLPDRDCKKRWQKGICPLTIVIQFVYLVLSDSRTGIVSLTAGIFFWGLFRQFQKQREKDRVFRIEKIGFPLLIAILTAVLALGAAEAGGVVFEKMDARLVAVLPKKAVTPEYEKDTRKTELENDASNGRLGHLEERSGDHKDFPCFRRQLP